MAKTWFITGASSGLGKELVQAVIRNGDKVAATFRQPEQASAFTQEHEANGLGLVMDITNTEQIKSGIQQARDTFGQIDVVVNNAGYGTIGAIEEFSLDEIRAQMDANFFGAVAVTKEFLPILREQGSGHLVQISSQSGFRAAAGFGVYNSSKFALEGFSEALAQEVAPFGIKVTIVEPGPFRTAFLAGSMQKAAQQIDAYKTTPVAGMYKYAESQNGKQEGDPAKAAQAIVDYVHSEQKALRLPLGKAAVQAIRAKLAQVESDLKANEGIAVRTVFE